SWACGMGAPLSSRQWAALPTAYQHPAILCVAWDIATPDRLHLASQVAPFPRTDLIHETVQLQFLAGEVALDELRGEDFFCHLADAQATQGPMHGAAQAQVVRHLELPLGGQVRAQFTLD